MDWVVVDSGSHATWQAWAQLALHHRSEQTQAAIKHIKGPGFRKGTRLYMWGLHP